MSTPKFPALYHTFNGARGEHYVRKDDPAGTHVATVTLSGYVSGQPTQSDYAELFASAPGLLDRNASLVEQVAKLRGALQAFVNGWPAGAACINVSAKAFKDARAVLAETEEIK